MSWVLQKFIYRPQVWLIYHLWGIVPIRVRCLLYNGNRITERYVWVRGNITDFGCREFRFTWRDSLLHVPFLIFVIPILVYNGDLASPLELRKHHTTY